MCGIIICEDREKLKKKLKQQESRGLHSLGLVFYKNNTLQTFKTLWTLQEYFEVIDQNDFENLLFLHHRQATIWEVNITNAHPFIGKKYVLFQNGTSKMFHDMYEKRYKKPVDSWNLLEYLEEHTFKITDIPKCLQDFTSQTGETFWIVYVNDGEHHLLYTDWAAPSYFEREGNRFLWFANFCDSWNYGFKQKGYMIFKKCWEIVEQSFQHLNTDVFVYQNILK